MKKILSALIFTLVFSLASQAQLYFGRVPVNSVNYRTTFITNRTNQPLTFRNEFTSGLFFYTNHNCYMGLQPYQSCSVQVRYWPNSPGYHSANINFYFQSAQYLTQMESISVWGESFR